MHAVPVGASGAARSEGYGEEEEEEEKARRGHGGAAVV
jgi:hypothetical protein